MKHFTLVTHPIPIPERRCTCGVIHTMIPAGAKRTEGEVAGFWWECLCCCSTIFKRIREREKVRAA